MTETQTLRVDGMTCAACTARVERMLGREDGVTGVRANLMTGTVAVDGAAEPARLAARLSDAGFVAAEDVTRLAIGGMTCASCVARVERVLQKVPGVTQASVNLAGESATIRHYAVSGLSERLAQAVRAAGYEARVATETSRADVAQHKAEEQTRLARAVILAAVLTLPVFVLEMGGHMVPAFHHWLNAMVGRQTLWIAQFLLTTAVLFGPGIRFFRAGVPALLHGAPDMNSLVVLGSTAAWGYSTVATFAPQVLPEASRAVYFEAAAMIVTLILLGRWLEARAKGRTGAAIARLVGLQPRTARRDRAGLIEEVAITDIAVGDLLHLAPGERVAVDGAVASGHSWLDESMISGEPVPVEKAVGADLTGGTVNGTGALTYRATAVGGDTVLARIIRMVEEAQGAKLPIQAAVDKVTRVFVPVVMAAAALTFAIWMVWGPGLSHALVAGVAVLIIACPCAMGLATPTSIMVGTGRGAEMGVLFRRGDALQTLQSVQIVAFDKTGTLTEGRPELVAIYPDDSLLAAAAAAETGSEHPIAHAILRAAEDRGLTLPAVADVTALTGFGLTATVQGRRVLIGAGRVLKLGPLTEYEYDGSPQDKIRSLLWERMVIHSVRPGFKDGFLLPYQEALAKSDEGRAFDPAEVVAFAPEDRFTEFSYATEHVGHDAAIAALLACRAALAMARKRGFGPFGATPLDRARREKQLAALLRAGHRLDNALQLVDAPSVEAAEEWAVETCKDDSCG